MTTDPIPIAEAAAIGRFQPLHNDHLAYLLSAKANCRFLWICLAKVHIPAPAMLFSSESARVAPAANPMTFFERVVNVRSVLSDAGVPESEYKVTAFPYEAPSLMREFLPTNIRVFTTCVEPWDREKVSYLEDAGYAVELLWTHSQKNESGGRIREMVRERDPSLVDHVPPGTLEVINRMRLWERL